MLHLHRVSIAPTSGSSTQLTYVPSEIADAKTNLALRIGCPRTPHFNLIIFTVLFVAYMMSGACVFIWLERDADIDARTRLRMYLRAFRLQYSISCNYPVFFFC
jgi:hypothetical protein